MIKKNVLVVILVVVLAFLVAYWLHSFRNEQITKQSTEETIIKSDQEQISEDEEVEELIPSNVPEGWDEYISYKYEWDWQAPKDIRVAFAYPSGWILEEQRNPSNEIDRIILEGDEYRIWIQRGGAHGMGRPYDYISVVGGYDGRTWQSDHDGGYNFTIGVIDTEFIIGITTPNKNTDISDEFLSTIKFGE